MIAFVTGESNTLAIAPGIDDAGSGKTVVCKNKGSSKRIRMRMPRGSTTTHGKHEASRVGGSRDHDGDRKRKVWVMASVSVSGFGLWIWIWVCTVLDLGVCDWMGM